MCACMCVHGDNFSHGVHCESWAVQLSPIYAMKNRCDMRCDKLCDRGNPCRTLSQRLIAKVEPGSSFVAACIATWDATCIVTWETQVASWALAYHVCFPLVALDLRQNSINRPSLSHVATTCRASHVAAIFS